MKNEALKKEIKDHGKTMIEIANLLGMSKQSFHARIKVGRFSDEELEKIAEYLGGKYVTRFEYDNDSEKR